MRIITDKLSSDDHKKFIADLFTQMRDHYMSEFPNQASLSGNYCVGNKWKRRSKKLVSHGVVERTFDNDNEGGTATVIETKLPSGKYEIKIELDNAFEHLVYAAAKLMESDIVQRQASIHDTPKPEEYGGWS